MFKKAISIMLTIGMLITCASSFSSGAAIFGYVPSDYSPEGTAVSTVDEFLAMEPDGVYYLANDIDFSERSFTKNVYTKAFTGTLDGCGHSLLGIKIGAKNSDAGIFANGFGGTLKNLTVGSEDSPAMISSTGGSYSVGAIAGTFKAGSTVNFSNLCIYAEVKGEGKSAGFASYMNSGNINIDRVEVCGSVRGNPASGFIVLSNDSGAVNINVTNSINRADITAGNLSAGGFFAVSAAVGGGRVCHLSVVGCANYGSVTASDWRAGGIVGEFCESSSSTLIVDHCFNLGPVTMTGGGGYATGLVGGMAFDAPSGSRILTNSYSAGTVRNTVSGGAYALAFSNSPGSAVSCENCAYISSRDPLLNVSGKEIFKAESAESLIEKVLSYPATDDGLTFLPDTTGANDGYPILSFQLAEHLNVKEYECGRKVCLDCKALLSEPSEESHSFEESVVAPGEFSDGYILRVCKYCGETEVEKGENCKYHLEPEGGIYHILNPGQLCWYSSSVKNSLLSGSEKLILENDIDLGGLPFDPICESVPFKGELDGNCRKISGLIVQGGLFGSLGSGAKISRLAIDRAEVSGGEGSAGTLASKTAKGAIVEISDISVTNSKVFSGSEAGGLIGVSDGAADLTVKNLAVDELEISGSVAGGVIGSGSGATLKNCYVNAKLSSSAGKSGTLAYYTRALTVKNCGYVSGTSAAKKDGSPIVKSAFSSGEVAYLINSAGNTKCFGVVDSRTSLSADRTKLIRAGAEKIYSGLTLSAGDCIAAHILSGNVVAFVQIRNGALRLVDSEITVNGEKIPFSSLKLSYFVKDDGKYYTAPDGAVIYLFTASAPVTSVSVNGNSVLN